MCGSRQPSGHGSLDGDIHSEWNILLSPLAGNIQPRRPQGHQWYTSRTEAGSGLLDFSLHADGRQAGLVYCPLPGSPAATLEAIGATPQPYIWQHGQGVFKVAVNGMGEAVGAVLKRQGLTVDDLRVLVPHQANKRIIDALANRLGLPEEKVALCIGEYGYTSAATIPLALHKWVPGGWSPGTWSCCAPSQAGCSGARPCCAGGPASPWRQPRRPPHRRPATLGGISYWIHSDRDQLKILRSDPGSINLRCSCAMCATWSGQVSGQFV